MSTPNPLAPQGSLLEKQGRGRSTVQAISFILALHVFVLCALLWGGCKQDKSSGPSGAETPLPGPDGSLPPLVDAPPVTDPLHQPFGDVAADEHAGVAPDDAGWRDRVAADDAPG